MMTRAKLRKIERMIAQLRAGTPSRQQVVSVATKLGRRQRPGGKHPTFVSVPFKELRPIAIPQHGSKVGLKRSVARSVLDDLEALDVSRHHEELDRREGADHGKN